MKKIPSLLLVLILLFSFSGCRKKKISYIFLLTLDTMRADAVNYKSGNTDTPNLAALASAGTRFRNCYSVIPVTLPSHASMFYSLYPHEIKLYNNGQVNNSKFPSLPQLMKTNGYNTAAVISLGVLKNDFGLDRGFDYYIENFPPLVWKKSSEEVNRDLFPLITSMKGNSSFFWVHYSDPHEPYFPPFFDGRFEIFSGTERIFSINNSKYPLIKKSITLQPGKNRIIFKTTIPSQMGKTSPYFINGVTYSDLQLIPSEPENTGIIFPENIVKKPRKINDYFSEDMQSEFTVINKKKSETTIDIQFLYKLTESKDSRRRLYFESVKYQDIQIGKLIDFLKKEDILDKSIILIVGDHGEGLGEYWGHFGHIHFLNKIYSHVPFIIYGDGISKGSVRTDLTSNLNIAPTILDLAGIKKPAFMQGTSVRKSQTDNKLILETFSPEAYFDAFSVIEYPNQIIFYPGRREKRTEYINLENDPLGINTDNPSVSNESRSKLLRSILRISRSITATKGKIGKRKRIHEDILKSLGYL